MSSRSARVPFAYGLRAVASAVLILASLGLPGSPVLPLIARAAPCDPLVANPVLCENSQPGNDPTEWDVVGSGDPAIQGFATDISVDQGQTVRFKITSASPYSIDIYRLGYYAGKGARKVATIAGLPAQVQQGCATDPTVGLVDCGNWAESATWAVPADAVSGVYLARLVRSGGGASHIPFIVRDDDGQSKILFQTSDTTWQAYNNYGDKSLYVGNPRARKVSYNRPFINRGGTAIGARESYLFSAEYPMIRWIEKNGYHVSYTTGVDTDRRGAELLEHRIFLSVGHDEYWSGTQRTNVENARNGGVNLAFFSGNEVFWKTRWEDNHRTLVSYKETHDNAKTDPNAAWTGTWRDPRFSPPADGGRPENALTGTLFMVNGIRYDAMTVPAEDGKLRFWRNTSIANLAPGAVATLPTGTLGYEWDEDVDNGHRPAGAMRLSSTTVDVPSHHLLDHGSTFGPGKPKHSLMLYRHGTGPSSALVFGAGTTQWSWGLDTKHDPGASGQTAPESADMQQATLNLFADMGVQPGAVIVPATSDSVAPTSVIMQLPGGVPQSVMQGVTVAITGTATDQGGKVGGVEVSTDGGATWHPASGRANWSYDWTPTQPGVVTLRARAVDDNGNLETPGPSLSVTVTERTCTTSCTIWPDSAAPDQFATDTSPYELGVKFSAEDDGWITGVRFYKGTGNTGTHIANLWNAGGVQLASAPFTVETPTGWQTATFPVAVAVTAGTTYVASYHAPNGRYARDAGYFSTAFDNAPLHALQNGGPSGPNGVFRPGASGFPNQAASAPNNATNYWVDVVFTTTEPAADITSPVITSGPQAINVTGVTATITWSTNELADTQVEYGTTSTTTTPTPLDPALVLNHSVTLIGLTPQTQYTYRVKTKDGSGNLTTSADLTFTTGAAPNCPCTIFGDTIPTAFSPDPPPAPFELGVKFRADMNGFVSGVRFYKGATNTGEHTGSLWQTDGTLLATATFTNETATGWQTVSFANPVPVQAGTTYIASYFTPQGGFADHFAQFAGAGVDNVPLHALRSGVDGPNGLYKQGSAGFPTNSVGSNYFVDVFFTTPPSDTTPPSITAVQAASVTTSGATITWTTNEPADTQVDYGTSAAYGSSSTPDSTKVLEHSVTLTGLAPNTTYHVRVKSRDAVGNLATQEGFTFKTVQALRSLQFNGTTAYAEAPNASELNVTGDWTAEAWFKDESPYGYFHLPSTILIKGDVARDTEIPFGLGIAAGALFVVEKANNQVAYTYYDLRRHGVSANAWHHVAATVKASTRRVTVYLDGVKVLEATLSRGTSVGNTDPVTIGRNGGPTGHAFWRGKIDDVRIWNRVRAPEEIAANYRSQFTTPQTGLVANWKADDGTGTTAVDSAGAAQNAVLKGSAAWSTDVHP